MMKQITWLAGALQMLFSSTADELALALELVKRQRSLTGSVLAQTLVFGWLARPNATLEQLTDFAFSAIVSPSADPSDPDPAGVDVSFQSLDERINDRTVVFFEHLLCSALDLGSCLRPAESELFARFAGVYVLDTTHMAAPDCLAQEFPASAANPNPGAAEITVQLCLEVSAQGIVDLQLGSGRTADQAFDLAHASLPAGSLRLADRGFFDQWLLGQYHQEGVFWITRPVSQILLFDEQGHKYKLGQYFRQQKGFRIDCWVKMGASQLPVRLVAWRLSERAAAQRQRRYRERQSKKGRAVKEEALALCEWDITVTNVPESLLTAEEVLALRRVRWQIELLFKLFKSVGKLGVSRGQRRERVLVELYAKLLGQVVQNWLLRGLAGDMVRMSWYRCSLRLQDWWAKIARALKSGQKLEKILGVVAKRLKKLKKKKRSKGERATFQEIDKPQSPQEDLGQLFAEALTKAPPEDPAGAAHGKLEDLKEALGLVFASAVSPPPQRPEVADAEGSLACLAVAV